MTPAETPAPIVTRLAGPADAKAIVRGHAATFAEHRVREEDYEAEQPFIEPYLRWPSRWRRFMPLCRKPRQWLWIALREDLRIGHLAACRCRLPGGKWAMQLADLTVYEGHRGTGVGRALVTTAERAARDAGAGMVVALIWPLNAPSQACFHKLGYTLAPQRLPDRDVTLIGAAKSLV